jgi:hypothetical protein
MQPANNLKVSNGSAYILEGVHLKELLPYVIRGLSRLF